MSLPKRSVFDRNDAILIGVAALLLGAVFAWPLLRDHYAPKPLPDASAAESEENRPDFGP